MSTCADAMELITAGQEESSRQLENIADLLKNINRVLLATQYSVIRVSWDSGITEEIGYSDKHYGRHLVIITGVAFPVLLHTNTN